jgi:hypothetical protein
MPFAGHLPDRAFKGLPSESCALRLLFYPESMKRRRAKAVSDTELPIAAGRTADWQAEVLGTHLLLPGITPGAIERLAAVARAFRDGRRMEAARAARPDSRKSLDDLTDLASQASELILELPGDHRALLNEVANAVAPRPELWAHVNSLGVTFQELADLDLSLRLPAEPEVAAILKKQAELMGQLSQRCSNLPMDAEWQVSVLEEFDILLPAPPSGSDFLFIMMRNLSGKCKVASKMMKSVRGPRSDTHRMRAVLALKSEFERAGAKATHNTTDTTGHTGVAASSFDRLVYRFFEDIDPGDSQRRGINDAISYACRQGRQSRRIGKSRINDCGRQQIITLLIKAGVTNFLSDK